MKSSNKGNNRK